MLLLLTLFACITPKKVDQIVIDRVSGKSIITGTKNRPVKFIFSVQE